MVSSMSSGCAAYRGAQSYMPGGRPSWVLSKSVTSMWWTASFCSCVTWSMYSKPSKGSVPIWHFQVSTPGGAVNSSDSWKPSAGAGGAAASGAATSSVAQAASSMAMGESLRVMRAPSRRMTPRARGGRNSVSDRALTVGKPLDGRPRLDFGRPMPRPAKTAPRRAPRQARAEDTIEILLVATEKVFARDGFGAATTNRIAEVAGVSIGTLYHYFPTKEALIEAIVHRMWARELAIMAERAAALEMAGA